MATITQRYEADYPIDDLVEHPDNPRRGDEAAIDASMAAHGFYGAVLAQASTRRIIAGNHRTRVARRRGEPTVPVLFLDVDDDQARRLLLVDNRSNDLAGYDDTELARLLEDLATTDTHLDGTGFSYGDLDQLLAEIEAADPDRTSDDYFTPAWMFERMAITFDLDVCAPPGGLAWVPAARYFTEADDGLAQPWAGRVWMNPPYSKPGPWIARFIAHGHGIALVPHTRSAWHADLWATADGVVDPLNQFDFVGGSIIWPVWLAAFGDECVEAIARLGPCRTLAGGQLTVLPRRPTGDDREIDATMRQGVVPRGRLIRRHR